MWPFQSTLSVRRATTSDGWPGHPTNISIHALREESDLLPLEVIRRQKISIHALREESDNLQRSL